MRHGGLGIVSPLVLSALWASAGLAQENYSTWTYSRNITLNTKPSGAALATPVTRFPVLVRLTHSNGGDVVYYSKGRGADLRFTKADGTTRLPHQIDSWDSAGHAATVWVLLDTVKANDSTPSIRLFWNKAAVADSGNGGRVFDTANGYVDVWHLGNTNDTATRPNAIPGRFGAKPMNFAAGYTRKPGLIGWADSLTGGSNADATTYLAIDEGTATTRYNFPAGNFSYSVWIYPNSTDNFARLVSILGTDAGQDRIFLAFSGGNIVGRLWGDGASRPVNSTTAPNLFAWNHVAYTIGRSGASDVGTLYLNGAQIAQATFTAPQQIADAQRPYVRIGKDLVNVGSDQTFNGSVDEPRIANVARAPEHLKLSYDIEKPGSTVVSLGATSPVPPAIPPAALLSSGAARPSRLTAKAVAGGMAFRLPAGIACARARLSIVDMRGHVVWSHEAASVPGSEIIWRSRAAGAYVARLVLLDTAGNTAGS